MNKLKFVPANYWNKKTMMISDSPTNEQWKELQLITDKLDSKYINDIGCPIHPYITQKILVGIFNGFIDLQITPPETCGCYETMLRLSKIRNTETELLNNLDFTKH